MSSDLYTKQCQMCFGPLARAKAIRDTSALEFTKVWGHKGIPTETHPTADVEFRQSPIQVLK